MDRQYEAAVQDLAASLQGRLIRPSDRDYDNARIIHNAAYNRRPQLIVQAADAADVIAAVRFAGEHDLELAVRSGGHSIPGYGTSDDIVVEFSRMKALAIDPESRTVRAEPGLTWGEITEAAHAYGLAVPAGDTGTVGVGGLTTGGGIGWLVRKHGLTIDCLLAVDIVTADGRLLRASKDENPDLFWAVRGGGGNFGIITAFEFRAHPVGMIVGGAIFYDAAEGESVLRGYADYARSAPDELTTIVFIMRAPPLPFIPPEKVGTQVIAIGVTYAGDLDEGQRVVDPLRKLGTPIADAMAPMPYPAIYMLTAEAGVPGHYAEVRSMFLDELGDDAIETMMEQTRAITSPFGLVQMRVLGGEMARVPRDATAFYHRDAAIMLSGISVWMDPSESPRHVAWTETFGRAMAPYANGVYVNFLSDEGEARIREAYGPETYERLAALKARYDPTNLFHLNQNVKPTDDSAEGYGDEAA
ncbi:MAG TPA: FAD-binding oxidoreductase [Chloroflexota bacterium]